MKSPTPPLSPLEISAATLIDQDYTAKDWPGDVEHENGNYYCRCASFGAAFTGNKHRIQCRECATTLSQAS